MRIRLIIVLFLTAFLSSNLYSQNKAIWATIWSVSTAEKVDKIISTAKMYNFNQIFIQVRYRADALYFPNKKDSTYSNPESRSYIVKNSNFDPLAYAIQKLKGQNIEVHAWVPVFVVTPHDLSKISKNHIYYTNPQWITVDINGKRMRANQHEGAFLDPGVPAVQQYMLGILCDIAKNYELDGIQLDYIRYPDSTFGYNPIALEQFKNSGEKDFEKWKQEQINMFVNKVFIQLKNINPKIKVSAAVFGNQEKAIGHLAQNWKQWINDSYIDQIYVMAYNTSNRTFEDVLKGIDEVKRDKTTIILRAWKEKRPYYAHQINEKIKISKRYGFQNLGYYSYSGLIHNGYLKHIRF